MTSDMLSGLRRMRRMLFAALSAAMLPPVLLTLLLHASHFSDEHAAVATPFWRSAAFGVGLSVVYLLAFGGFILLYGRKALGEISCSCEEKLRSCEEKWRAQYLAVPIPTFTLQQAGNEFVLVDYNTAMLRLTEGGITRFVGRAIVELFGDRPDLVEYMDRCFAKRERITMETWYRTVTTRKDLFIRFSFVPVSPDRIVVHAEDRTEDKQNEAELIVEKERFQQMADNIDLIFWIMPLRGDEIIYINRAYEAIFGRTVADLCRDHRSWMESVHNEDRHMVGELTRKALSGSPETVEFRITRPDGGMRWLRAKTFPIHNERGEVYRIAGIAEDITEQTRLRQETEHRLQQVIQADKLASLGELVAGIAHEINNPSSFICYNIPLLEDTWVVFEPIISEYSGSHPGWRRGRLTLPDLCRDMQGIIEAFKEGSERINRVVGNLKDFARLDASTHKRPVQVNEVIEKTMTIVGAQLRKSFSKIDLRYRKDLPLVQGHFHKLEQVVANLLLNAVHAVKDRASGRISLTTRYVERLRCVLIEIEDNGIGMEKEVLSRIFEPFFTTRRTSGGTGLGLSVSYGLIQEHKGRVAVLSRPGQGSRFTVLLPVDESVELDLKPTIVVVDDDPEPLGLLRMKFARIEEGSEAFEDPTGVLEYIENHPEADLVITDLRMPQMSGWELLRRIKARFPLIPVIVYTGDESLLTQKPEGVPAPDFCLKKPFGFADLADAIYAVGRQRL